MGTAIDPAQGLPLPRRPTDAGQPADRRAGGRAGGRYNDITGAILLGTALRHKLLTLPRTAGWRHERLISCP